MTRAELIKALGRLKIETGSIACLGCGHEHNCSTQGCAIIRAAVEELSAADVRPVVRGRWEDKQFGPWGAVYATCSACRGRVTLDPAARSFCPSCGADMREA